MNVLASLMLAGVSALPVNATLDEEIVVLTAEDIEQKRSPVYFGVHRQGDTGFSIDFKLAEPSALPAGVGPYQLEVLSQPVSPANLSAQLAQADLVVRTEVVQDDLATFELRNDEIPNSALMIYLASRARAGVRKIRGFCLPLTELIKALPVTRRQALAGNDHPSPA